MKRENLETPATPRPGRRDENGFTGRRDRSPAPVRAVTARRAWGLALLTLVLFPGRLPAVDSAVGVDSVGGKGGSAIELISGFDATRLRSAYPVRDSRQVRELAKLLYRVNKIRRETLRQRLVEVFPDPSEGDSVAGQTLGDDTPTNSAVGQVIKLRGVVTRHQAFEVPSDLVDLLDFRSLSKITLSLDTARSTAAKRDREITPAGRADPGAIPATVLSTRVPPGLRPGDRIEAMGIRLRGEAGPVCAAGRLGWFPKSPASIGHRKLARQGFDLSSLSELRSLDRKPFGSADASPFYRMIRVAESCRTIDSIASTGARDSDSSSGSTREGEQAESPEHVPPVQLLRNSKARIGDWIAVDVETVRITRIPVPEPERREQLGGDHYFQIDAIGKLGDVEVQISRFDGDPDPVRFVNRYPVSVVARSLPPFLSDRIAGRNTDVVTLLKHPVRVEGFFYRLWSYQSDFMQRESAGDQFGPLLIASTMHDRRIDVAGDPAGVAVIGYGAAIMTVVFLVAVAVWSLRAARGDRKSRDKRRTPDKLNLG